MLEFAVPRWRRWVVPTVGVGVVVVASLASCGRASPGGGDADHSAATRPTGPLFGGVDELTPVSLPPGWARCGGGRATVEGAESDWWSQTFGPTGDGGCLPWITVTQMPPDDEVWDPSADLDGKVGNWDVLQWTTDDGSRSLFTWAFQQNLLFQSCCHPAADEELEEIAEQSLLGLRERAPANCTGPESDLSRESLLANLSGHDTRMFDTNDCPIRVDIVNLETLPSDHHCWPGLQLITIGTPFGTSTTRTAPRTYIRDPDQLLYEPTLTNRLDLDADLPATAADTGYRQGGRALWLDAADDSVVYVMDSDGAEAWPRYNQPLECA
jgi:hypothetical protein